MSPNRIPFEPSQRRRRRSSSTESITRSRIVSLQSARQNDSGTYNCTAVNGAGFVNSSSVISLIAGAQATTTTLEVRVLGKPWSKKGSMTCHHCSAWSFLGLSTGPVDIVQYLRFSVVSFLRASSTFGFDEDAEELPGIFESLVSFELMS